MKFYWWIIIIVFLITGVLLVNNYLNSSKIINSNLKSNNQDKNNSTINSEQTNICSKFTKKELIDFGVCFGNKSQWEKVLNDIATDCDPNATDRFVLPSINLPPNESYSSKLIEYDTALGSRVGVMYKRNLSGPIIIDNIQSMGIYFPDSKCRLVFIKSKNLEKRLVVYENKIGKMVEVNLQNILE